MIGPASKKISFEPFYRIGPQCFRFSRQYRQKTPEWPCNTIHIHLGFVFYVLGKRRSLFLLFPSAVKTPLLLLPIVKYTCCNITWKHQKKERTLLDSNSSLAIGQTSGTQKMRAHCARVYIYATKSHHGLGDTLGEFVKLCLRLRKMVSNGLLLPHVDYQDLFPLLLICFRISARCALGIRSHKVTILRPFIHEVLV